MTKSKNFNRRHLLQAGLAAAALPAWHLAAAQDKYPSKPLKIVVPLPAGGVADNSVRVLANAMQTGFGQPIVIENKPGGTFAIGMNAVTQAPADGYTLLHINIALLSAQVVFKRFDVFKQLQPVAGLGETDIAISATGTKGYKSVQDLIADGRAHPGKLSYATPGSGTMEHLALINFCKAAGIDALHVPMKGGPDMVKALIQGEVDFGTLAVPLVQQFVTDGRIRALMLLNEKRNAVLPQVPTYVEEKVPTSRLTIWGGFAAPAGTPPAVMAHLENSVLEAMRNPEVQKQFLAAGLAPHAQTGDMFGKVWRDDYQWISKAATEAKLALSN